MTTLSVSPSFPVFTDRDGSPLENGYIWIGTAALAPITNPISVYWDAARTQLAAQPIRTLNGYPSNAGTPARLYVGSDYSMLVQDSKGTLVYTSPNATERWSDVVVTGADASEVNFLQAGTGADPRTVQSKLRDVVSVKDFGAVGNGIDDDTQKIQAALTAGAGKTVLFPAGATYRVTSGLSVPANTVLDGYGATLSCTASQFNALTFVNGGGCFGLTIVGPASGTYDANGIGIRCVGTNNAPAAPTFVNAPTVRDCTITNFGVYGVFFSYVNGGLVEGCKISGIGYTGVGGVSCNDTTVTSNNISTIGPGPGTGDAYGVFLDRNNGTSETEEPRSYRCGITNNDIRAVVATGGANGQGIDTHAGIEFVIADNRINGCQVGIAVTSSVISGTPQLGPKRVTVSGNVINGLSVGYGILLSGAISGSSVNEYAEQVAIENNVILNHGAPNDSLTGGILAQATKGCVIAGNTLRNQRCVGINLNLENLGIDVSSNTIADPHDNTFTAPVCLRVTGNNVTGWIGSNIFVFENSGLNTYVAAESIRVASGLTGLSLTIGQSSFVGLSATRLTYSELTSTGVNSSTLMVQRGQVDINLTNSSANTLTVTFEQRFPTASPRIQLTRNGTPVPGTVAKPPILESSSVAATSFDIIARPYDLTTFGGSGTIKVDWIATT